MESGGGEGGFSFTLPEMTGTKVHEYKYESECAEHNRANTKVVTNKDVTTAGGSFSVTFPVDPSQKTIRGSITVQEEDGSKTDYTWELRRK
jgi:hypothetical protein